MCVHVCSGTFTCVFLSADSCAYLFVIVCVKAGVSAYMHVFCVPVCVHACVCI